MTAKKRFIAGAKCPKCQQQDTLRWWLNEENEYVECVECDFFEAKNPPLNDVLASSSQEMIGIFKP